MKYTEIKKNLDSKLQSLSIYFIRILNIPEVIPKTSLSKSTKCSTLRVVRYEDLAMAPITESQRIYDFVRLPFPSNVKQWINKKLSIARV